MPIRGEKQNYYLPTRGSTDITFCVSNCFRDCARRRHPGSGLYSMADLGPVCKEFLTAQPQEGDMVANDGESKAGVCQCGRNPQTEPHPCPFSEDVYNDSETLCTCCYDCEHACAMDI